MWSHNIIVVSHNVKFTIIGNRNLKRLVFNEKTYVHIKERRHVCVLIHLHMQKLIQLLSLTTILDIIIMVNDIRLLQPDKLPKMIKI